MYNFFSQMNERKNFFVFSFSLEKNGVILFSFVKRFCPPLCTGVTPA